MGLAYSGGAALLHWGTAAAHGNGTVSVPLLGDLAPWRIVFLGVGVPGILLSILLFTIQEPPRPASLARAAAIPLSEVILYVRSNWRTFVLHNVGMGFISITGYTASFWDIAFFARTYQWPAAQSGRLYGLMAMVGSIIGALAGGWVSDWLTRTRGRDAKLLVLAVTAAVCVPIRLMYPLMPSRELAIGLAFVAITLVAVPYGVAAAALQIMVPSRMRGQLTAVYFFVHPGRRTDGPRVSQPADAALLADPRRRHGADPGRRFISLGIAGVSNHDRERIFRRRALSRVPRAP
jgi:hypothetical protein